MNDSFFAVIKLITGEEIVGYIETHNDGLIVHNPLLLEDMSILEEIMEDARASALKLSKWIKSTTDNFFFINDTKIVTVNELVEPGLSHYKKAVNEINEHEQKFFKKQQRNKDKKKYNGYRCTIKDARTNFEDLFNKY